MSPSLPSWAVVVTVIVPSRGSSVEAGGRPTPVPLAAAVRVRVVAVTVLPPEAPTCQDPATLPVGPPVALAEPVTAASVTEPGALVLGWGAAAMFTVPP